MEKEGKRRAYRYRWMIFAVLGIQYLVVYFHRVAPAVVAPDLVTAFSISGTSLGLLASAYLYPYAIMQLPVGILSDSWGPRKTITLFSLIAALGALAFGFAPVFSVAITARALVGLGVSAVFVAGMKLFASWFRPHEYGRVSSLLMAIGGIGWFTATTPLAYLAYTCGWRFSFIVIGSLCLVLTALTWWIIADSPDKKDMALICGNGSVVSPVTGHSIIHDLSVIGKERHFWAIAVWFTFRGGALFGFFALWAGPFLMDVYGLSQGSAGSILSMIAFAMIFVSPLIGHLSDRTLRSRKKVLVWTSVFNCLLFLWMILFFERFTQPWLYLLFFFMGATISSVGTLAITATKEFFPPAIAGTAMGAMNLFPFIGGIFFQPFMGYVLDKAGKIGGVYSSEAYKTMIWVYFVTRLLALGSILFSKETLTQRSLSGRITE